MKLSHDCIRDLMLYLEENLTYENDVYINNLEDSNYSKEDILYTAERLEEAGFIQCIKNKCTGTNFPLITAQTITYTGHEFLNNIRDNKVWTKTKGVLSHIESASIEIVSETAAKVISNMINS